jgi:Uma2 family endonuclease
MSRKAKIFITAEEYLALERGAEYKSEYLDGEIFAMTGASREHNLIAGNVFFSLKRQLQGRKCEIYMSDMRVRVRSKSLYTYPDVAVVCGESRFEDDHGDSLLNPVLIVEVLSKTTAAYDRTIKFGYYRTIETLDEYLLIAQEDHRVEQYVKQADGRWMVSDIISLQSKVELASVSCVLELKEIYDNVNPS